ncbi:MAG: hypothetical protein ACRCX2_07880 [Paraclostridium sp.]
MCSGIFKVGDIVVGKNSGNHIKVESVNKESESFSGTIIKIGKINFAYSVGHFSDDWAIQMFKLLKEEEEFWRL